MIKRGIKAICARLRKRMAAEHRSGVSQLPKHHWATDAWLIARLALPLAEIAARNGLVVQGWVEDGWGPQTGCGGRLPSGIVILLVETAHMISRGTARGPDILADATDAYRVGTKQLLSEALSALGLAASDVEARNRAPTEKEVASLQEMADEFRRRRAEAAATPPDTSPGTPHHRPGG
jgi:hypothetical protein